MKFSKTISDFIAFTQSKPGEQWVLSGMWSPSAGWRVKWVCADRALEVAPSDARKLARYLRDQFRQTFNAVPADRRDAEAEKRIQEWCDRMDGYGKATLANNRAGLKPESMAAADLIIADACRRARA